MVKIYAAATSLQKDETPEDKILAGMGAVIRTPKTVASVLWGANPERAREDAREAAVLANPGFTAVDCVVTEVPEYALRLAAHDLGLKEIVE